MKAAALLVVAFLVWPASRISGQSPLDRRVTVHMRDVALRDALDRVAALAGIRLSYSAENVPLDRRVSIARDSATVDAVLADLLRDLPLQPVPVAADHVVLTPRPLGVPDTVTRPAAVLDRVVVTGNVIGASERPIPVALDIVRGREAERRDDRTLSTVLDGSVPGVWMWEQSPSSMLARYGSIRGASSFGLSYPKVYVDGIEVANPLLFTQIQPEIVDRVEVIRGPQGAALYGADAISGVVNVVSRHDGTAPDGSHMQLRSQVGYAASSFSPDAVAVQEHALTIRAGSNLRSGGVTIGGGTTGGYVPQAYSREIRTLGDSRVIGPNYTWTTNSRFYAKNAGVPANPLLVRLNPEQFAADSSPQQLRMYALGSTLTLTPAERWTYTFTGGVDGYRLANVSNEMAAIPSAADTALRDAGGAATRLTMRASGVTYLGDPSRLGSTFTFGVEHSLLRDRTHAEIPMVPLEPGEDSTEVPPGPERWDVVWGSNTGLSAQLTTSIRDRAYITTGVRGEHIADTRGLSQDATLPMIGGAFVQSAGPVTMKFRAAYGKGIRAPRTTTHLLTHESRHNIANPNLKPEEQAGTEFGVDVMLGRLLGVHVTRFDQLASGLIQTTVRVIGTTNSGGSGTRPEYGYQLQNVGEIINRGWEGQASLSAGPWTLSSAGTLASSRVRQVASGYSGDLLAGDRMLGVPSRTLSVTGGWNTSQLQLSTTVARAWDWVNYDRLAIAQAFISAGANNVSNLTGTKLRQYWVTYPGATRLRASAAYDIWHGTYLTIAGDNLLNYQRGEPDSITIVPGRTITLGLRAHF